MRRAKLSRGIAFTGPILLFALGSAVRAQSATAFELQAMRPNPNPSNGGFVSLGAKPLPHGHWGAHLLLNHANDPLVLYDDRDEWVATAVSHQTALHLMGSIGLWNIVEVGIDLPVVIDQAGGALPASAAPPIRHSAGLGDLRIVPRAQFLNTRLERLGIGLNAAAALDLFLPTGDRSGLRGGDLRVGPLLAFEATFSHGHKLGTNVGYLYRRPRRFGDLRIADTLGWSAYGEAPVFGTVRATAEVFGRVGDAGQSSVYAPVEALIGAKATAFGVDLLAAGGAGVGRSYGTPDWRALFSMQFPLGRRAIPVAKSAVRELPPAAVERPPTPEVPVSEPPPEPAEPRRTESASGKVRIDRRSRLLELADKVHFQTASTELAAESLPLLDEVATLLIAHPEIKVVTIEGHTDNRGERLYNLRLSGARAEALRRYLTSKGVASARLKTAGYGPDRPIAVNSSARGRALNRRVEFLITEITREDNEPE